MHKPTLYRVFGTKDEIFVTILHRYLDAQMTMVSELIDQSGPGIEGIHEFLDGFAAVGLADAERNGCLMVLASNELSGTIAGHEDFAGAYRRALRELLSDLLIRTLPDSHHNSELIAQRSELLTTFLAGFQVAVRAQASDDEIRRIVGSRHAVVDTW